MLHSARALFMKLKRLRYATKKPHQRSSTDACLSGHVRVYFGIARFEEMDPAVNAFTVLPLILFQKKFKKGRRKSNAKVSSVTFSCLVNSHGN